MAAKDLIRDIPQEIFDHILSWVSWRVMENCGRVNKSWREAILASTTWKTRCSKEGYGIRHGEKTEGTSVNYINLFYHIKYRCEKLCDDNFETRAFGSATDCYYLTDRAALSNGKLAYISMSRTVLINKYIGYIYSLYFGGDCQ